MPGPLVHAVMVLTRGTTSSSSAAGNPQRVKIAPVRAIPELVEDAAVRAARRRRSDRLPSCTRRADRSASTVCVRRDTRGQEPPASRVTRTRSTAPFHHFKSRSPSGPGRIPPSRSCRHCRPPPVRGPTPAAEMLLTGLQVRRSIRSPPSPRACGSCEGPLHRVRAQRRRCVPDSGCTPPARWPDRRGCRCRRRDARATRGTRTRSNRPALRSSAADRHRDSTNTSMRSAVPRRAASCHPTGTFSSAPWLRATGTPRLCRALQIEPFRSW